MLLFYSSLFIVLKYIAQVPQRLLGPSPFSLDRLIAILGVLLEEYDVDERQTLDSSPYNFPGEETEMELQRTSVYSSVCTIFSTFEHIYSNPPTSCIDQPACFYQAPGPDFATRKAGWSPDVPKRYELRGCVDICERA